MYIHLLFSPYLASGVISARACLRGVLELSKRKNLDGSRDNGVGMWVQEIGMSIPHNIVFLYVPIYL